MRKYLIFCLLFIGCSAKDKINILPQPVIVLQTEDNVIATSFILIKDGKGVLHEYNNNSYTDIHELIHMYSKGDTIKR